MSNRRWWLRIARYARPQLGEIGLLLALALVVAGIGLLTPWPLKLIVDYVLADQELPTAVAWVGSLPGAGRPGGLLAWLSAATVLLFLLRRTVKIAQKYVETGAGVRMVYNLSTELFHHLQRRSLLFHGRQRTGDLVKRVTADTRCVRELVLDACVPVLTSLATLGGIFFVVLALDRRLAIFALTLGVPMALVACLYAKPMSDRVFAQKQLEGDLSALAEQTLTAVPVVQAFGQEARGDRDFRLTADRAVRANFRSLTSQMQFNVSSGAVNTLATAVVMTVGGFYVLEGSLTVGSLLVLMTYFASLYSPIETIAYLSQGYANASAGARRVLEVMDAGDHGVREPPDATTLPAFGEGRGAHIRFDSVRFGYRPGEPVLQEITLDVKPGETVALVGPTGAGKSTLVSLIPRLYDPWAGAVLLDGHDLCDLRLQSLRGNVAMVLQEPFLLPLTIAENIAYGRPGASRADVVAAARAASAHGFISALPEGYDTNLGPRGATLSGGERQRIAIARALLIPARVLILDEPTAALDAATETALVAALDQLKEGRTTLIIAHRLSTVRKADRIIVLEDGRITETGTHDELLAASGRYARFLELQLGHAPDGREQSQATG